MVNEGMSKKEEEKLNERLAELEDKVEQEPTEPEAESAEDQALEAAQDYYAAAAAGNFTYTYNQGRFTEEEWLAANTALSSDDASYDIYSTEMVDDTTATVALTITAADGSIDDRTTLFVYEDGDWKHELTQREYDLFAGATATVTATASANGSPNPSPNRNAPNPSASEDCISEGGLRSHLGRTAMGMVTDVRVRGSVPALAPTHPSAWNMLSRKFGGARRSDRLDA